MTYRYFRSILLGCLVAAWPLRAMAVDASTKSTARELSIEAKRDYDAGRFDEAARKFQQAFTAAQVPSLALWAARAFEKQGKLVAASELYRKAATLQKNELWVGEIQVRAKRDAADELEKLLPRLARLIIKVKGTCPSDLQVSVDDVEVPSALLGAARTTDPGSRSVVVQCDAAVVKQEVALKEGEQRELVLSLEANGAQPAAKLATGATSASKPRNEPTTASTLKDESPAAASSNRGPQWTWGWVGIGIGTAGLALGATTGLIAKSRYNNYDCANGGCDPAKASQSDLDTGNTLRSVSTIGFIVGGVGLATGVTLLLTSRPHDAKPSAALLLRPDYVGMKGTF